MYKEELLTVESYRSKEDHVAFVMKIIAIAASIYGMCRSFSGWMFFTYFTNLSNIFVDIVLLVFAGFNWNRIRKDGKCPPVANGWYIIKFMATISITLTFLIYLLVLAPTDPSGFLGAYMGNGFGSLCVHFVCPVLAILDFCLFDYPYKSGRLHVFFSIVPPLCYVGGIVALAYEGVRWNGTMYAPYNFLNFGAKTGWFGFDLSQIGKETLGIGVAYMMILLVIIFIGIGLVYLAIKNARRNKKTEGN